MNIETLEKILIENKITPELLAGYITYLDYRFERKIIKPFGVENLITAIDISLKENPSYEQKTS